MKTSFFFKQMAILLIASLYATSIRATNVVVNVPEAGQLSSVRWLSTDVDSLTITGFLNGSDFSYMCSDLSQLTYLNLSDVTVIGEATNEESGNIFISEDVFPSYAFFCREDVSTPLTTIILPASLVSIGDYAFSNCSNITSVTIPNSVTTIGEGAFWYCTGITSLTIGEGVTFIGYNAFYGCDNLKTCRIYATTPPTIIADDDYSMGSIATVYVPKGTANDYKKAFYWSNKSIVEMEDDDEPLTGAVTVNVPAAGQLSSVLPSIDVNSLIVTGFLNSDDFYYMRDNLPQLVYLNLLAATVTNNSIPDYALRSKTTLEEVILPASILSVGREAFDKCSSLAIVRMPNGLQTLEDEAFSECALTGELILPNSLVSIGSYALDNNLITKVVFPEGLQTIYYGSFQYCPSLTGELVLPSSIVSIYGDAFVGCSGLTSCKIYATTPPSIEANSLGNIATVYVPKGTSENYKKAPNWERKTIIEMEDDDEPATGTVTVTLTQAGTLGEKILEQIESLYDVNTLIVSGPFNDADWALLKNNLPNLVSIDLSATTATAVPEQQFYNKSSLLEIKLPSSLLTIGNYAFYSCRGLTEIEIPSTVTTIGYSAFSECDPLREITLPASLTSLGENAFYSCDNLESVIIPDGVTQIGYSTFAYCSKLKQVTFPANLIRIEGDAFYRCTSLQSVEFPNSLTVIGDGAFAECTSLSAVQLSDQLQTLGSSAFRNCPLEEIILPATLTTIGYTALNNATIKKITCLQPVPSLLNDDPFSYYYDSNVNKTTCELVVPFWAETAYKLANIWSQFQNVSTWNAEIDYLPVTGVLTLNNVRPLGTPTVEIMPQGNLNVSGNAPFDVNDFILRHQFRNYVVSPYYEPPYYSQLISDCNVLSAQNAKIDMSIYGNRWYYLSFPFDVAISDVSIDDDAYYVFRYYDGASRAIYGSGSSWKNVEQADTLRAGTGYIFQCSTNVNHLVLQATGDSKNRLFTPTAQALALNEYPADNAANGNWNLAGNPFPSYYDIRYLDYTAPITYWNDYNWNYEAVSPLDDAFLLQPMQAFFVQKPNDLATITFIPEGRQTSSTAQSATEEWRSATSRILINLTVSNENFSDKSRIVLNPAAQLNYEIERDAAKFMSTTPEVPQLYSIDASEVHYAINERPLDDGTIALGFYAGSADSYAIAVQESVENLEILLKDKLLNTTVDLSAGEYTFDAEAGTSDNRFELQLRAKGEVTGLVSAEDRAIRVYAMKGAIVVENAAESVSVYSINGVEVVKSNATGAKTILPVSQGVYVVKAGDKVFKTVVF